MRKDNVEINDESLVHMANNIAKKIIEINKSNVKAIGLFGSIGDSTYNEFSDIDLVIITEDKCESQFFILKQSKGMFLEPSIDIKISIFAYTSQEALDFLVGINKLNWPIVASMFIYVRPIYDPKDFFKKIQKLYKKQSQTKMANRKHLKLAGRWLSITYEYYSKLQNTSLSNEIIKIYAKEFIFHSYVSICLVNKKPVKKAYDIFNQLKELKIKPKNLINKGKKMLKSNNPVLIRKLSNDIWRECVKISRNNGAHPQTYTLSEILVPIAKLGKE